MTDWSSWMQSYDAWRKRCRDLESELNEATARLVRAEQIIGGNEEEIAALQGKLHDAQEAARSAADQLGLTVSRLDSVTRQAQAEAAIVCRLGDENEKLVSRLDESLKAFQAISDLADVPLLPEGAKWTAMRDVARGKLRKFSAVEKESQ